MNEVGTRIKTLRDAQKITCTELATKVGLTPQCMWNLENGYVGRTYDKLPKIAKALGCRIDDLFPEMDETPADEENKTVSADGFAGVQEDDDDSLDCLVL